MPLADSNRESLAGLTLDDVLANRAAAATSSHQLTTTTTTTNHRTLLDIIREDESSKKDRKSWKAFKDKLRLKRAESAWASSVLIPASDIPLTIWNYRNLPTQLPRRSSVRVLTFSDVTTHCMADPTEEAIKSSNHAATMMTRQRSTRQQFGDAIFVDEKLKPQMSRPGSSRLGSLRADSIRRERVVTFRDNNIDNDDDDEDGDGQTRRPKKERQMSAREAVAAQEAAEAAAAQEEEEEEEEEEEDEDEDEDEGPFGNGGGGGAVMTMSLMDLLEETDRQMGLQGSKYRMDDDDYDDDDFDEDEDDYEEGEEHDCCVCMVKHRGAPFEPCGHSFCRMCSRELTVSKGNCPLCNNFILEILEVF